jgi:succinoglycan biosynthesis protein ExoA
VHDDLPGVTVLIAARPNQAEIKAVSASLSLEYPAAKLEILVARGRQPSAQRNAGIKAAKGELIYFLDDDSVPQPASLARAVPHFSDPNVKMVGGPNVCPPDAPWLEQVFGLVLSSWLAFGPSRARYVSINGVRRTSEKELILCNLIARRQAMLDLGGFNEALYPNEENALMDELQRRGGILIYDPQFTVQRRPRSTLRAFARMAQTYGRGRAEQFRVNPTPGSIMNFVPPAFLIYLLAAPLLTAKFGRLALLPLLAYALCLITQASALLRRAQFVACLAAIPLIVLTHILYGFGFLRGLATRLDHAHQHHGGPNERQVVVEKIQP